MALPVRLRPEAQKDMREAFHYYKRIRKELGASFVATVHYPLDRIAANPRMHGVIRHGVRKTFLAAFPCCVYYRVEPTRVDVFAIVHTSRHPSTW